MKQIANNRPRKDISHSAILHRIRDLHQVSDAFGNPPPNPWPTSGLGCIRQSSIESVTYIRTRMHSAILHRIRDLHQDSDAFGNPPSNPWPTSGLGCIRQSSTESVTYIKTRMHSAILHRICDLHQDRIRDLHQVSDAFGNPRWIPLPTSRLGCTE